MVAVGLIAIRKAASTGAVLNVAGGQITLSHVSRRFAPLIVQSNITANNNPDRSKAMARKLSDELRCERAALSKWGTHPVAISVMDRAADELDKRAATIRRLQNIIDAKNGATCVD